ncbi:site-specific DNA-methyltransferase [Ruminococcus sp.]|uniref:site-specific DNA-methyltransferase n=2 Tax=Ruminococcus sp. TaxID=41978 RepID=UPI0039912476
MTTTTEFQLVDINKLVPYANNARTHNKEQILKLRSSLREFGFVNPVIIDREYNVLAGHGRIMAAKEEGITEVPCVYADHLTEAQKKAYILADNRMALDAGWDEELLSVEMQEQLVDINKLVPYANNARTHNKEQILKLRSSLREFGFVNPVIIDKEYNVLAGHGRIEAAKEEGIAEVPCVYADHLTEAQKKAYILADNRMALDAGWDDELLSVEMQELQELGFDLGLTGFDESEIADLFDINSDEAKQDDFDVDAELEKPCKSKTGDIWHLGKHTVICGDSTLPETYTALLGDTKVNLVCTGGKRGRLRPVRRLRCGSFVQRGDIWTVGRHKLMCGDATSAEDVSALMGDTKANLILTDPPYGVSFKSASGLTIQNDSMKNEEFYTFLLSSFQRMAEHLEKGGSAYVFHADTEGLNFRKAFIDAGFHLAGCCIWVKDSLVLGRSDYQWQHEPVLYGFMQNGKHHWYSDRKQTTIWHFDKPKRNANHPTSKPLDLLGYPIGNSTQENGVVMDTFGGSGSTLMACEQLNRICYTMELDEKYASVILRRYVEDTGDADGVYVIRDGTADCITLNW